MPEPVIELRGLTKRYPLAWKRKVLRALDALDLTVYRGEVFGLLGPNGSGKSTTMKLILGLIRPSGGEATIFGHRAGSLAARRRLGFLPENPYFYKFLRGDETLRFYGRLSGLRGPALERRIDELIELVGLGAGGVRERPLSGYSKGMLQRIGLAQALLHDPDLILLDEPTAGVDPLGAHDIKQLIRRLRERGKTIVFSSHLLEEVEAVADRVAILHLGKKVMEGPLSELLQIPDHTEITVRGLPESAHAEIAAVLARHGGTDVAFEPRRLSLEQLFIRIVKGETK
jgi:ABC-2 type transport system ATP-binding protein